MNRSSYLAAAVIALAFSGPSFANDPAQGASGAAAGARQSPSAAAATHCESLTGTQREQCIRDARSSAGAPGSTAGATSGTGAGATGNAGTQPKQAVPAAGPATSPRP